MAGGITTGAFTIGGVNGNLVGSWKRGASAYELAVQNGFQGTVAQWLDSIRGESIRVARLEEDSNFIYLTFSDNTFIKIPKGQAGSSGNVYISRTYTDDDGNTVIVFSDKSTVVVSKGNPGISPTVSTESIDNGYRLTITDANGESVVELFNGENGANGLDGIDGKDGADGKDGENGADGKDGKTVEMQCDDGVLKWRHVPSDDTQDEQPQEDWHDIADLNDIAITEYNALFNANKPVRVVDQLPSINDADEGVIYVLREEV